MITLLVSAVMVIKSLYIDVKRKVNIVDKELSPKSVDLLVWLF